MYVVSHKIDNLLFICEHILNHHYLLHQVTRSPVLFFLWNTSVPKTRGEIWRIEIRILADLYLFYEMLVILQYNLYK